MSAPTSTEASPSPSPINTNNAPKYGTLVPNRIFVGGISANTTESELHALFSNYGNVKATKIISDRAGVSKGYGFVTFETEEEAKRIQKEADNIVLKDRKLNIAPAIKKQPFTRLYDFHETFQDSTQVVPNGTVLYHNGMPYTYQNGMAFFTSPENNYPFPQPQAAYPMIYPQPMYLPQQQYQYQTPAAADLTFQAQPQWGASNQWRWAPPIPFNQNPGLHHATQFIYPHNAATAASATMSAAHGDAFQYAQPAAHAPYQQSNSADLADIPIMEATPAEGFVISFQESMNIMEPHRQSLPMTSRQVPQTDGSRPVDYILPSMDQGNNKGYKKNNNNNNNSPRKNYAPPTSGRLQHRQKFLHKNVNGLHILAYNSGDKLDDMHAAEVGIQSAGGPITPPSTPMTPLNHDVATTIIESTRKLQALSL